VVTELPAVVLVTVSVPDAVTGDRIADALVEQRLAACVKRSGPVRSTYRWEGRVQRGDEWLLGCVTVEDRVDALAVVVRALHPYEVPEVVATAVVAGDAHYLEWVAAEVGPEA
jgi:periplasmic divalent cation tolerance protein